jgi:hypothetical protein
MKIKEFFEAHPVFRYEEFAAFMTALGTTRPESWRQQLGYHQKGLCRKSCSWLPKSVNEFSLAEAILPTHKTARMQG